MIGVKEKEYVVEQAMLMILHAGNAREKFMSAMDLISENQFEEASAIIIEGKGDLTESHKIQTALVQKEAKEESYYYSMLFSHAQDTLMTVQSEYHLINKLVPLFQKIMSQLPTDNVAKMERED